MIIKKWPAKASIDNMPGMMVRCSETEALLLIRSLTEQLITKDPNTKREEFVAKLDEQ